MSGADEKTGHVHRFDPVSGYCARCGFRDDGRLVSRAGDVYRERHGYIAVLDDQAITTTISTMKASTP